MQSKFGLVIRGDSPSTSRFYDLIASGTIPIVISKYLLAEGLPFTDKIDYEKFTFFVDEIKGSEFNNKSMEHANSLHVIDQIYQIVTSTPEEVLAEKFKNLLKVGKELLWRDRNSKVVDNILQQASSRCNA